MKGLGKAVNLRVISDDAAIGDDVRGFIIDGSDGLDLIPDVSADRDCRRYANARRRGEPKDVTASVELFRRVLVPSESVGYWFRESTTDVCGRS